MKRVLISVVAATSSVAVLFPASPAHATTILVTTINDETQADVDNSLCSLREAITAANNNAPVDSCPAGNNAALDTIALADGATYQLTKTGVDDSNVGGDLDVFDNDDDNPGDRMGDLTITTGTGSPATIQQTIGQQRVFHLDPANEAGSVDVTFDKVAITGGTTSTSSGAGILSSGTGVSLDVMFSRIAGNQAGTSSSGGGIQSLGPLTIRRSEIENNTASNFGGGIFMGTSTSLEITQSTLAGNHANADGGALYLNGSSSTIRNVTFSENDAGRHGGAVYVGAGTNTVEFTTIHNNSSDLNPADGVGEGGGVYRNLGTISLTGTILAGNTDTGEQAPDCFGNSGTGPTSNGDNLIGDTTGCSYVAAPGDIVDLPGGAQLETLEVNSTGGPFETKSHLPLPGSPAVDAADCIVSIGGDQRGMARPQPFGGPCDIGAVEVFFPSEPVPLLEPNRPFVLRRKFGVAWQAANDPTGISRYLLRPRTVHFRAAGFDSGPVEEVSGAQTETTFRGKPGSDVCLEARYRNGDLRMGPFGSSECTALPVDDRSLAKDGAWSERSGAGYYLRTFSQSKQRGATLEARRAKGIETVALVVTKCPGCGKVVVTHGDDVLERVRLNADAVQKRRLIQVETFANPQGGTFGVTVKSDGKPVRIEGLGLSKN